MNDEGRQLAEDLAKMKSEEWICWTQIPLGSVFMSSGRLPHADVLAMSKSFAHTTFIIYEVKVTRADFQRDVNRGKYLKYFDFCNQFFFACPTGVLHRQDMPDDCGLIVKGDHGWSVVSAPRRREYTPDPELLVKLLITGYKDRQLEWKQYERLKNLEYRGLKEAACHHGIKIAHEIAAADELMRAANKLKDEIGALLGREYPTLERAVWELQGEIKALMEQRKYAKQAVKLAEVTLRLFDGTHFFVDGIPRQLRELADDLANQIQQPKLPSV